MTAIQQRMFAEMQDKKLFERALSAGCSYLDTVMKRNVYPSAKALDDLSFFEERMPVDSTEPLELIAELDHYGSPGTVAQVGGRYFGFVNGSVVPAGLAAKILGSFWDQNTALHVISPISSKLEKVVEGWLKEIFKLPPETVAGFVSGTSMANLCGLAAARYRLLKNQGWDINKQGLMNAPSIRIIAGREAHSTIIKTIGLLGYGIDNIEFIDTDDQGRINIESIPEPDNSTLLILGAGNVNTGAFDDFSEICQKAKRAGAWVHIDGAFGLWAAAVKELRHLTRGMENANSWAVDGHKTLNTPYDSGIIMCSDKEALSTALHMSAGYIVLSDDRDGMFFTPEMSRRARIIELWATLKYLGTSGIDDMIDNFHRRTLQFKEELENTAGIHIINDVVFNQLLIAGESDDITERVMREIQEERVCWMGGSTWKGKKVIRISVCSWATTEEDVSLSVASVKRSVKKVLYASENHFHK